MSIEQRLERLERLMVIGFKKALSVADVAMMMNISESRVRHMANDQEIPSYKHGGRLYFDKDELENHFLSNRRPSKTEIDSIAATRCAIARIK